MGSVQSQRKEGEKLDQGVAVNQGDQGGKQVMVLYGIVLYCTILYYTVLYCSIPYYTVLYCTILYYTVLYRTVQVVEQQGGAGGGARWSKEQGGREGAENGVDYQVWSSVQCPVKYIELKIRRLKNFGVEEIVKNVS